jgi:hypothetical protein
MNRTLPLLVAFGVVLGSGVVHGVLTSRWQTSVELENAVGRVDTVPLTIGPWQGRNIESEEALFRQAGAQGYWVRRYEVRKQPITVILMCGPSGKMAVHNPEVCYQGAGYALVSDPRAQEVKMEDGATAGTLFTARFRKPQPGGASILRIDWGWNAHGVWLAPDSPRWTFRGEPFLYKLYIVREIQSKEAPGEDPNLALLKQLLPALQRALFAPQSRVEE